MAEMVMQRSRARLWRDILGLLRELWAAHPLAYLGTLALLLIGNARTGLYATAMGGVVSVLAGERAGGHSALFWLGVFIFASALEEFHWTVYPVVSTYLRDHGTYRIQRRVLERAAAAPLIQFEEGAFFTHLQRATESMGERLVGVYDQVTSLGQTLVMLGSIAVALYVVHPLLLPLIVVGSLPALWLQVRVATAVYQAQREHTTRDRVRTHLQHLLTGREAAAEVRLFGSAGYLLGRWNRLRDERKKDILRAEKQRALSGTLGGLFSGAAYAAALVLVVYLILHGRLSIGNYVTVAFGALVLEGTLGELTSGVRVLEEHAQFLGDLFDFWRVARVEAAESTDGQRARIMAAGAPGLLRAGGSDAAARGMAVEADGLTFSYPGASRPVVRDVRLRIERGERIALVGENGAGKTTLVKLLISLYQPDAGTVRLDGVPLGPGHAQEVRRRIAAVFQDYATFQLTARENIGFGDLARMPDDRALAEAAGRAGIADLIEGLPQWYDTYLGRQFGETELSGGQWQRMALARAFFRDADLLVLDEPTAALDPLAELALFERFAELVAGRTAIMISHRLGVARLADRVLVLHDGEIVEEGHHDSLVARGGVYAALFAAQAQWYR